MAGMLISKGSASSVTEASPDARWARIARRVGSARVARVVLRWSVAMSGELAGYLTGRL
jgi:hypothetical protein